MKSFHSILPACAVAVGLALVMATSSFTNVKKTYADEFWVLSDPNGQPSTDPSDYVVSTDDGCGNEIHFCGFTAPETAAGEPDISGVANLTQDIIALQSNPDSQTNNSGALQFKDPLN